MNKEEFIKNIYDKTIIYVIDNIDKSFVDEVTKNYSDYINKLYSDMDFGNISKEQLNIFVDAEVNEWKKAKKDFILTTFVKDENFNSIKKISDMIYDLAVKKVIYNNDKLIKKSDVIKYKMTLKQLLPNVYYFNKNLATQLVNDTIIDLEYIIGNDTFCSLRLGRIIEQNNRKGI